jgi:hypothetical protein
MCINSYKGSNQLPNNISKEEYDLIKKIYASIDSNNLETSKTLTQKLIDQQSKKGNENVNYLEEALNNFK